MNSDNLINKIRLKGLGNMRFAQIIQPAFEKAGYPSEFQADGSYYVIFSNAARPTADQAKQIMRKCSQDGKEGAEEIELMQTEMLDVNYREPV